LLRRDKIGKGADAAPWGRWLEQKGNKRPKADRATRWFPLTAEVAEACLMVARGAKSGGFGGGSARLGDFQARLARLAAPSANR
jgi:hypothetical protein